MDVVDLARGAGSAVLHPARWSIDGAVLGDFADLAHCANHQRLQHSGMNASVEQIKRWFRESLQSDLHQAFEDSALSTFLSCSKRSVRCCGLKCSESKPRVPKKIKGRPGPWGRFAIQHQILSVAVRSVSFNLDLSSGPLSDILRPALLVEGDLSPG
jgi:hypothetical protein